MRPSFIRRHGTWRRLDRDYLGQRTIRIAARHVLSSGQQHQPASLVDKIPQGLHIFRTKIGRRHVAQEHQVVGEQFLAGGHFGDVGGPGMPRFGVADQKEETGFHAAIAEQRALQVLVLPARRILHAEDLDTAVDDAYAAADTVLQLRRLL